MSIFYITGKPRGGKSYLAVEAIYKELCDPKSQRFVVTNIALNFEHIAEWLAKDGVKHEVNLRRRVRVLNDEETGEFWCYEPHFEFKNRKTIKVNRRGTEIEVPDFTYEDGSARGDSTKDNPGTFYVIDEVHIFFPSRAWQRTGEDCTYFLSQHGKLKCDVCMVTQHVDQCDKALRRLAQDRRGSRRACARSWRSTTPAARCRRSSISIRCRARSSMRSRARSMSSWWRCGSSSRLFRIHDADARLGGTVAARRCHDRARDGRGHRRGGCAVAARRARARDQGAAAPRARERRPRARRDRERRRRAGPLVALPLDRKIRVVGVLAVARAEGARQFSDADLNLLTTFADQAGAAVENALLYQEVRGASEELEKKVRLRTAELTAINSELGRALADLRETQAQLVLSERMAGLGVLVAGVAHEINSPTAAIRGSIEGLAAALGRVARHGAEPVTRAPTAARAITAYLETTAPELAERPLTTGVAARKLARELAGALEARASPTRARAIEPHRHLAALRARTPSRSRRSSPISARPRPTWARWLPRSAARATSRARSSPRSSITSTCTAPRRRCATRSARSSASSARSRVIRTSTSRRRAAKRISTRAWRRPSRSSPRAA